MKIVRDDDNEKIKAHEREFDILKGLHHKNIVKAIEMVHDNFKNRIY